MHLVGYAFETEQSATRPPLFALPLGRANHLSSRLDEMAASE
jgi:hypothetical protein